MSTAADFAAIVARLRPIVASQLEACRLDSMLEGGRIPDEERGDAEWLDVFAGALDSGSEPIIREALRRMPAKLTFRIQAQVGSSIRLFELFCSGTGAAS